MRIREFVSLKKMTTLKIGGVARYFCAVERAEELSEALAFAREKRINLVVFGGGSNVLIADEDIDALIIKIDIKGIGWKEDSEDVLVVAGAGESWDGLVAKAVRRELWGVENLSGIPGTVGAAPMQNIGAYGVELKDTLFNIEAYEIISGAKRIFNSHECAFGYRDSVFKHKPILVSRAVLKLREGDRKNLTRISRQVIKIRLKKYKPGLRCPGSFFKNVLISGISKKSLALIDKNKIIDGKIPAGYLLEEVSAKGMKLGGTKIADFHGNLFVNTGGAKAAEVERLAKILKSKVQKKFHINLEEEIHYF